MNNLHEAIIFAARAHSGQKRKGTDIDYLVHPMEVLQILTAMGTDETLQIAGVLHDTVEDTPVEIDDIKSLFGDDVAALVAAHTEKDKSLPWRERKEAALAELANAPIAVKALVLADKLSNMRSIAADYEKLGDELWTRFNAGKEAISWYYSAGIEALWELEGIEPASPFCWELNALYKDVFVTFAFNEGKQRIYQMSVHGENFYLTKGDPTWYALNEDDDLKDAVILSRAEAEKLEDSWNRGLWEGVERDLEDGEYPLFSGRRRSFGIRIKDKCLFFDGEDWGKGCEVINGKDEYEYHYNLDSDNTKCFLTQLRLEHGREVPFGTLLTYIFCHENGMVLFLNLLEKYKVNYGFYNI